MLIARLDRLARKVAFIANLMESGVDFVAVDRQPADHPNSRRPLNAPKLSNAARVMEKPARHVLDLMTDWRTHGKDLREIARELNRLNIRTPRGCQWYARTVKARLPLLVAALQDAA